MKYDAQVLEGPTIAVTNLMPWSGSVPDSVLLGETWSLPGPIVVKVIVLSSVRQEMPNGVQSQEALEAIRTIACPMVVLPGEETGTEDCAVLADMSQYGQAPYVFATCDLLLALRAMLVTFLTGAGSIPSTRRLSILSLRCQFFTPMGIFLAVKRRGRQQIESIACTSLQK